jgi:tRNA 2-selenouridine synthase
MNDHERAQVGICYKQSGQGAAIELGHRLVSGAVRQQRLAQWLDFTRQHPQGYLYCFRGGLRSQTVQRWLHDAGVDYPLVIGGYKAMRRFLLDELERSVASASFVLVSGKTGTGKTRVIHRIARAVDLEGLANHRGSSFGQMPSPQPSQIDFENSISIALLRLLAQDSSTILLEDEGRLIGRLSLPEVLREKMRDAPMVIVEESLATRIEVVIADYIVDLGQRFAVLHGDEGMQLHSEKLQHDLARIHKRLGGQQYQMISAVMAEAFAAQWQEGDLSGHRRWIGDLLEKYYDPMYEYQLSKRTGQQLFRGDRQAVIDWSRRETGWL